jgi:hypothetical protein
MAEKPKVLNADESKEELVRLVGQGKSIADALRIIGKSRKTYEYYRRTDPDFVEQIERQKILVSRDKNEIPKVEVPDFPEFSEKYLKNKLFYHQLQWFDMLEGREPRDLHPSMTYEKGMDTRLIVNTPPGHAKSTTITVNYVLWRIIKNPDIKIIIVSKAQRLAEQFLLQIKERLTNPEYGELQADFAPAGGWKDGSVSWKANQFYIGGRSAEGKDPTVQALGIGGQIYGSRSDLIILDDTIDNTNVNDYDKQIDWLQGIVNSRLAPRSGRLLIVGTRIAAKDLYSQLRDPNRYRGGKQPWTYLLQPAVLEYAEDPGDWKTLWPYSDSPADPDEMPQEDGLYYRWDGYTLATIRDISSPAIWSRIYQQEQFAEENIFKAEAIAASCQPRKPGLIPDDPHLGRIGGMKNLRVIAGLDPASVGHTAAIVVGLDINTGKRYILDIFNKASISPDEMRDLIKDWTLKYGIKEWRIERNAFQAFLTRDTEINRFLASNGCILVEHTTNMNKHDPNFGVMAMASLFDANLVALPNGNAEVVKSFVDQLVVWQPNPPRGTKTDMVMAWWFTEIRALELIQRFGNFQTFRNTPFTTRADKQSRFTLTAEETEVLVASGNMPRSWWGK